MDWPMLGPREALASYAEGHPLRALALLLCHLAEHPAVAGVWLNDPPADPVGEIWVSVQMRARPSGADAAMERFADTVARRFGWWLDDVRDIGWDGEPEYWALIWLPASG